MSRVRNSKDFEAKQKKEQSIDTKASKAIENIGTVQRFEKKKLIKKAQEEKLAIEKAIVSSNQNEDKFIKTDSDGSLGGKFGIQDNHLHFFASYATLFTLSGLNERELKDSSFLRNTVHDVIARSGGIGDPNLTRETANNITQPSPQTEEAELENKAYKDSIRILKQGRDIFFEDVNLTSTVAPSEERGMADFVKMEFKLHEPFGISLIEKIRAAARLNGYRDYQDAPMLLTIEFKGYDENGVAYNPSNSMIRKIPILITRVEFDVNEGGAIYDVTAVRHNDIAFDDRFKFPRTAINFQTNTLRNALTKIQDKLNESIKKERDEHKVRTVLDKYVISVDPDVEAIAKDYSALADSVAHFEQVKKQPLTKNERIKQRANKIEVKVAEGTVTNLISLTKVLEDVVRSTNGFESIATDFWTSYLRRVGFLGSDQDADSQSIKKFYESGEFEQTIKENAFVPWFKIKTSVETHYGNGKDNYDTINKMHRKTVTYKIIPHQIPVLRFIRPGMFAKKGTMRNAIKKQYNYIYTGKNTDVQSLRINYKTAFFQRNVVEVAKANDQVLPKIFDVVTRLFPQEDTVNKDVAELRSYPSIIKGRNLLQKGSEDRGIEGRKQEFFDYLTNPQVDMFKIELEILGDPAYICQDQFIPLNGAGGQSVPKKERFSGMFKSFNVDNFSPLIELVYSLPDDINEKTTGLTFQDASVPEENLLFAGVYQVVRIESSFSNGQFIQTLSCVRLNNQSGLGADVAKITAGASEKFLKSVTSKENLKENIKTNTDLIDEAIGPLVP